MVMDKRTTSVSEAPPTDLPTAIHALPLEHGDEPRLDEIAHDPIEDYVRPQDSSALTRGSSGCVRPVVSSRASKK